MRDFAAELEQSAGRCGGFTMEKPGKFFGNWLFGCAVWLVNSSEITSDDLPIDALIFRVAKHHQSTPPDRQFHWFLWHLKFRVVTTTYT